MQITVYGAGYVGLVSAVCFAELGYRVLCVDVDVGRVNALNEGHCPIYEDKLEPMLQRQLRTGQLQFSHSLKDAAVFGFYHFLAVGTPSLPDGNADLSQLFLVAKTIVTEAKSRVLLICKSTVPVGTCDRLQEFLAHACSRHTPADYALAANPEFLREGSAIDDFLQAERIVVGGDEEGISALRRLYQPLIQRGIPYLTMSQRSAELAKYAANAMLACRISFMNNISQMAEVNAANIDDIRQVLAHDARIGSLFLNAGIGFGGSCFPKDVRALQYTAAASRVQTKLFEAITDINNQQQNWIFSQLRQYFKQNLGQCCVAFWGLSFKPGTDDLREASSMVAIKQLLAHNVRIVAYDPAAMPAAQKLLGNERKIAFVKRAGEVFLAPIHALVIATEWPEFKNYPLGKLRRQLKNIPIFDGRNCFALDDVRAAKLPAYFSVGRPLIGQEQVQHKKEFVDVD